MIASPEPSERLAAAMAAVTAACGVTRAVARGLGGVGAMTKGDKSPVTVADFAAQAVVSHVLRERLGAVALIAEESARELAASPEVLRATVAAVRAAWPEADEGLVLRAIDEGRGVPGADWWTLDPVDGTKGFLRGEQYAIALAWVRGGEPAIGVLGCPNHAPAGGGLAAARGSLYCAERGAGAWERPSADGEAPLRRLARRDGPSVGPIVLCASVEEAHSDLQFTRRVLAAAGGAAEPVRLDSQCKYAVVARGDADVYLRVPRDAAYVEKVWDHAAGAVVAEEAGCRVTDLDGAALDFSRGAFLSANRGILCATGSVHPRILSALRAGAALDPSPGER